MIILFLNDDYKISLSMKKQTERKPGFLKEVADSKSCTECWR